MCWSHLKNKISELSSRHSSYTKPPCSSPLHLRKRQLHSSNCSNQQNDGHVNTCLFLTLQLIYHDILLDLTSNTTYSEFGLFLWPCHHHDLLSPNTSVQFSSFAQSCQTLCDSVDCSSPGFPVHHQLLKLAQTNLCPLSQWCHSTISSSVIPI